MGNVACGCHCNGRGDHDKMKEQEAHFEIRRIKEEKEDGKEDKSGHRVASPGANPEHGKAETELL